MKLYHGTNMVFDKIDLRKSKPNKDFGQGFYLSPDYGQALNMAKIKAEQQQEGEPIVMEFEVEEGDMKDLHTLVFDDYSEQWAEFMLALAPDYLHFAAEAQLDDLRGFAGGRPVVALGHHIIDSRAYLLRNLRE